MIKKLAACIRENKVPSILSCTFVTLEVIMEVYIPFIMADMIDYGINAGNMENVTKNGILLLICSALVITFGNLAGKYCAYAGCGFAANLRHDMYLNIQSFSFKNIDKFSTSSLITRMTTDVQNVQNAYMMLIRGAFRSPLMAIFASVMAFRIYPKIAILFIAILPILAGGLLLIMSKTHPIFVRVFKTYDKLNQIVEENLLGMRVVKSFVTEDNEIDKFKKTSSSMKKDFIHAEMNIAWNAPLMQGCTYTIMILISWIGAKAIVASGGNPEIGLSTGMLTSLITYALQILMGIMMFSFVYVMAVVAREPAARISEVLSEKSDLTNCDEPVYEIKDGSIKFENVYFKHSETSEKYHLDNINLDIKSGETIGIIGGTGSSKSTLVQLIPRLYDAVSGRIEIGGVDVRKYDLKSLRDNVSMVLQKNVLFSGTVKENLLWGNESATDEEIKHAAKLSQADEFINSLPNGYDTYIEQGGTNVSGGQKQRLCIARALLKKPKILILDDSTSAVDTATDAKIQEAFRQEIPDTTKIIIAQRISSVQGADRIIVMNDGMIDAVGTHDELLKSSSIYREVYDSQVKKGGISK